MSLYLISIEHGFSEEKQRDYQFDLSSMSNVPGALVFLKNALNQDLDNLLIWLRTHGFGSHYSEEEKATLFICLVLTDFYTNYNKPNLRNALNEKTPFFEHLTPVDCYSTRLSN
ncbi:hypothetical protein K501DRAFT_270999 [Backusella circina FSU 941]|nr:hypothetical protein K501DRAFT_270999 [Backusella circina FSU 941]